MKPQGRPSAPRAPHDVRRVLVGRRVLAHGRLADHDVDQVHRALEDGLLDVGHAVLAHKAWMSGWAFW